MSDRIRKVQVLKHPNGKSPNWYVRYWIPKPSGKGWTEKWKSTGTTVKRDAENFRRRIEAELGVGRRPYAEMIWHDFVNEFLEKQAVRQPPKTNACYKLCLQNFTKTARPQTLASVTVAMLEDFANSRIEVDQVAVATVNKELRHIKAALRWAQRRKYVNGVPDFKGMFIREDRRKPVVIPEQDFRAMLRAVEDSSLRLTNRPAEWWRVFLYLAYYLGLRRGELLGLTWNRVSLTTLEVIVEASSSKGRKERVIPLARELGSILDGWKSAQKRHGETAEVLPWPYQNYRQLYADWHTIQKAAGIPDGQHYVPKNCRSSCASALIAGGAATVVVKDFLGHQTVATTETYYINTKPALRAIGELRKIVRADDSEADDRDDAKKM